MHKFDTRGWPHLEAMEALFPNDQAHGRHAYSPTTSTPGVSGASSAISAAPPSHIISNYGSTAASMPGVSGVGASSAIFAAPPSHIVSNYGSTAASMPGVSGVYTRLSISGVPPGHIGSNYGSAATSSIPGVGIPPSHIGSNYCTASTNSSSHTSSNLLMTPSVSTAALQLPAPWYGNPPSSSIANDAADETMNKAVSDVNVQPQMFVPQIYPSHPSMQPLTSPMTYLKSRSPSVTSSAPLSRKCTRAEAGADSGFCLEESHIPSAQAALQTLSLKDNGEHSSKRAKKKEQSSTPALLVSVQGSLTYLASIISASSPAAAQQRMTDKLETACAKLEEQDRDLPINVKIATMEAFCDGKNVIDLYMLVHDKDLRRKWLQACLHHTGFLLKDYKFV